MKLATHLCFIQRESTTYGWQRPRWRLENQAVYTVWAGALQNGACYSSLLHPKRIQPLWVAETMRAKLLTQCGREPRTLWTSHIAHTSVISLLGQSWWTSKYSPVHGAWQRFSVIVLLVLCYAVHLGSTENINKRFLVAPSSYYFFQNEILYNERVYGLLSKIFFIYFTDICPLYSLWGRKSFHLATVKLCTSCSQTADRKASSLKSEMKFNFCWGIKKSIFKLVWMNSTSPCNSLFSFLFKWRWCSLVCLNCLWKKPVLTIHLSRNGQWGSHLSKVLKHSPIVHRTKYRQSQST